MIGPLYIGGEGPWKQNNLRIDNMRADHLFI